MDPRRQGGEETREGSRETSFLSSPRQPALRPGSEPGGSPSAHHLLARAQAPALVAPTPVIQLL